MKTIAKIITIVLLGGSYQLLSQDKPTMEVYGGLQTWMRYTELNPGSSVGVEHYDQTFDISVRRYRLGFRGAVNTRISYNLVLGNNNLSRYQKDQPPKLLDAYVNYKVAEKLNVTVGKHGWTGLSRYASPSPTATMGADINFSANPILNAHDDLFRRLGIALHGDIGKLDYRMVLSKPFAYRNQPALSDRAVLTDNPTSLNVSGYIKYQFRDMDTHAAFTPWTYLGEKEVLNIGAGFTHQSSVSESVLQNQDTISHPMLSFAVDIFYEIPIGRNTWTLFMAYYNHDLGPGFIRYIGANNPANGGVNQLSLNGEGNSFPEAGTGEIYMAQLGYLRAFEKTGIQPNFMVELADFGALQELMLLWEAGVNYILDGHRSKISFTYQDRPIFVEADGGPIVTERKGMMVLQYQLLF